MPGRGQVPWNKKFVDETAFDELDERKATMLGLLLADAYLNMNGRERSLRLQLVMNDPAPILALKDLLKAEQNIGQHMVGSAGPYFSLTVTGLNHLGPRLQQLGLTHPKQTRVPIIPEEFNRYVAQGYFEGDGSVWWAQPHTRSWAGCVNSNIAAHAPMAEWLGKIFDRENIEGGCYPAGSGGCLRWVFGKKASHKLYHYIYDDSMLILIPSKKAKFEELLSKQSAGGCS
jgi:hypothetical protein